MQFVGMWFDKSRNFCHVATAQLQISWVNMITTVSWYATYAVIRMIWSNLYSWLHTLLMCNHYKTRNCLFMTTTNHCTRYKDVISFGYIKQDALKRVSNEIWLWKTIQFLFMQTRNLTRYNLFENTNVIQITFILFYWNGMSILNINRGG